MTPKTARKLMARRRREGLTLVEIMVVIAILGVLMAVLGGNLLGALDDANVDATKLTMGKIDQALQIYAAKHKGKYPSTSQGLEAAAKYMPDSKVPQDAWGNEFQYVTPGPNGQKFDLISLGEDGQQGGTGNAEDIRYSDSLK